MPHKGKKLYQRKEKSALNALKKKRKRSKSKLPKINRKLLLKNIPLKATEKDLHGYLKRFGEISQIKLFKTKDGNSIGQGFVHFRDIKKAAEAVQNCNGQEFMGRKMVVDWAVQKPKAEKTVQKKLKSGPGGEDMLKKEEAVYENKNNVDRFKSNKNKRKHESEARKEVSESKNENNMDKFKRKKNESDTVKVQESENGFESKENEFKKGKESDIENVNGINKKGRLIVRNLPFKINKDILHEHFKKYGEVVEVCLLRKPDGQLVGCGFVQFTNKNCAAKAILSCSGKPLLGRTIIVDWAVPKSIYKEKTQAKEDIKIKKESEDDDIKESGHVTSGLDDSIQSVKIKEEPETDESEDESKDRKNDESEDESKNSETDESEDESERRSSDSDEDFDNDNAEESKEEFEHKNDVKSSKVISNDVSEGRTVFVKNVPFSATNEDLKACMEQFGRVLYALICIDPITEHSKGTAFVKFQKKESADECLAAGTELTLNNEILDVHKALSKEEVRNKAAKKMEEKKNKDSRNLYLVKEGVIIAGSKAAFGVSMSDMAKRLQIEKLKSQMLRNLNMFVSPTRLIVHNLPPTWTEKLLRKLFLKHAGPKAVIKEARIMRNMKDLNAKGVGKSKEYGFVEFTNHENALQALRNINNNPKIFSASKRPIVGFSIENRAVIKIKQKRLEKSLAKNPLYSGESKKFQNNEKGTSDDYKRHKISSRHDTEEAEQREEFVGMTSRQGNKNMRARYKLDKEAKKHHEMLNNVKKTRRIKRRVEQQKQIRKEKMKEKQKMGKMRLIDEEDKSLDKLVEKYKSTLLAAPKEKWYES